MRIPAIAEADEIHEIETIWGPRCFARRQGEALHPEREPLETLEREKAGRSHRLQAASTSSTSIDSPEHGVPGAVFVATLIWTVIRRCEPKVVIQPWSVSTSSPTSSW